MTNPSEAVGLAVSMCTELRDYAKRMGGESKNPNGQNYYARQYAAMVTALEALADHPPQAEGFRLTKDDGDDLNRASLTICEREVRGWPSLSAGMKTDVHAAVKAGLSGDEADAIGVVDPHPAPQQGVEAVREKVGDAVLDACRQYESIRSWTPHRKGIHTGYILKDATDAILAALRPSPDSGGPKP